MDKGNKDGNSFRARLFPLPNAVLFPHVWFPLHIFEPRYRQMTEDSLRDDNRFALILPKNDRTDADNDSKPKVPIHSIGTIGSIVNEQVLADGRYLLMLRGEKRIRIHEEVPTDRLYRVANASVVEEESESQTQGRRQLLRAEILRQLHRMVPGSDSANFREFLQGKCTSGMFADVIAHAMPLAAFQKQQLLEETRVAERLELLLEFLRTLTKESPSAMEPAYPPPIELN